MKSALFIMVLMITSTYTQYTQRNIGHIEIGMGVCSLESNTDPRQEDGVLPFINTAYNIDETTSVYLTGVDELIVVRSSSLTGYGLFTIDVGGDLEQAWKDPFLTDSPRSKADAFEVGATLGYGSALYERHLSMLRSIVTDKPYVTDTVWMT